ncbi:hypothetical protein GOP47_0017305 [Adiantum capillus-veneris]|uniref:Homeobox domain-containing protein n=1 Tax=Adiantum capillus-veneris TaxID=13818 RepID=A0A9D4UFL0_ADICA|nr:hypothetical protein GOP47_0017305 [Adiantum capillus-veneris]
MCAAAVREREGRSIFPPTSQNSYSPLLENRAGKDIPASAAKANMPDIIAKSSVCMAPFPSGQASSDVRMHPFASQHQMTPADRGIPAYTSQQHTLSADMRGYALGAQQIMSSSGIQSHAFAAAHQPVCSIALPGQVMTDEQLETLRRQISVYATICQQLVEMHKAIMAQQGSASGLWLGPSIPFDSSLHSMGHKLTSRQRWTPSQTQLHILERLFEQESGTPNKQRIKEITLELSQHGQISETNVYNWFQNRRARTKRKQQLGGANNGDSELDTDVDIPEEKKGKIEADSTSYTFDAFQATGRAVSGADNMDHHQGTSDFSQRHLQLDNDSMISLNRDALNGHHDDSHLVDSKVWDLSFSLPESKPDFATFSGSQDFQRLQMLITGAESNS